MEGGTGTKGQTYETHLRLGWVDDDGKGITGQAEAFERVMQCARDEGFAIIRADSATTYEEQPVETLAWAGEPWHNRKATEAGIPAGAGRL